jgi:hypothetical protein
MFDGSSRLTALSRVWIHSKTPRLAAVRCNRQSGGTASEQQKRNNGDEGGSDVAGTETQHAPLPKRSRWDLVIVGREFDERRLEPPAEVTKGAATAEAAPESEPSRFVGVAAHDNNRRPEHRGESKTYSLLRGGTGERGEAGDHDGADDDEPGEKVRENAPHLDSCRLSAAAQPPERTTKSLQAELRGGERSSLFLCASHANPQRVARSVACAAFSSIPRRFRSEPAYGSRPELAFPSISPLSGLNMGDLSPITCVPGFPAGGKGHRSQSQNPAGMKESLPSCDERYCP